MTYIHPDKVKEIHTRANANIVSVISSKIKLEKSGNHYKACCPFHSEKRPSFIVTPEKGIYKCFGCGRSGNAVKFIMDHDRLSFKEAFIQLAKHFNIDL